MKSDIHIIRIPPKDKRKRLVDFDEDTERRIRRDRKRVRDFERKAKRV